jgi:D-alanyl-D-alanine carboxypeptidase
MSRLWIKFSAVAQSFSRGGDNHVNFALASMLRRLALLPIFVALILVAFAAPAAAARYAAMIMDAESGAILHQTDADEPRYPASLTKIMTLYMLFEAIEQGKIKMTTRLPVSAHAASQSPTKLDLDEGDLVPVRDLMLGLITKSANDAAVVIAEGLGGTEDRFADQMTRRARKLGMNNTTFQNASGLPNPHQITTAHDLAILARALIQDFPQYYGNFSTPQFTYGNRVHANHNRLMTWYNGADGIKTGYIRASGFNLVTSAVRNDRRLIGVVLGGTSPTQRDQQMARLLDGAFGSPNTLPEVREARGGKKSKAQIAAARRGQSVKPETTVRAAAAPAPKAETIESKIAAANAAAAAPAAPRESTSGDNWGIQVGAYSKADAAREAARKAVKLAPTHLDGASVSIAEYERKKKSLYRARLVGVSEKEARQACRVLERKGVDCRPLSPADLKGVQTASLS